MAITDEIPKSRLTLTYRTDVQGKKKDVQLPFRLVVMGNLSNGTSTDRRNQPDLDQRDIRTLDGTNLNEVMGNMDMKLSLQVENRIEPGGTIPVELPVDSMKSFEPANIAQQIPQVRSLLLIKKLLLEVQANMDNRKTFRQKLRALAKDDAHVTALITQLDGMASEGDFKGFKIPPLPSTDGDSAGDGDDTTEDAG